MLEERLRRFGVDRGVAAGDSGGVDGRAEPEPALHRGNRSVRLDDLPLDRHPEPRPGHDRLTRRRVPGNRPAHRACGVVGHPTHHGPISRQGAVPRCGLVCPEPTHHWPVHCAGLRQTTGRRIPDPGRLTSPSGSDVPT
ncbi:hypothetical protein GCM10010484_58850 [Actinokineospora globicatena]